jgi:hypothetical protein
MIEVRPSVHVADRLDGVNEPFVIALDRPDKDIGLSNDSRDVALVDLDNNVVDAVHWRTPLIVYLCNPSVRKDMNIQWIAFKYVLIDDSLYHCTRSDVFLKCLDPDDAILVMAKVHEGICGTHQSTLEMK